MLLAHISDLHLGKSLHNFSLIEDQKFILDEILDILKKKKVDVLMIAGDVYDKNIPPEAGIKVFGNFLKGLVESKIKVLIISGNHDSAERLTFGGQFMNEKGIYFSKVYDGNIEPVVFEDEEGPVNFYLLPFIKPQTVQHYFEDEEIKSYEDAVKSALNHMNINKTERNVIVSHQNIQNAERCESEEIVIGMLDAVSDEVFKDFDYAALGHIHKNQKIGKHNVVYSGTPLKYSVSELNHDKVMPLISLGKKGEIEIENVPLVPARDLRQIRGTLDRIMTMSKNDPNCMEDFIDIILTDEDEVMNAMATLRSVYPNVLKITYDNKATRAFENVENFSNAREKNPLEVFEAFYLSRRGQEMSLEQKEYIQSAIDSIWGEN